MLVSSLQAVGAFLTLGLLVGPAATVYLLTNKPSHLFWGGGIIGGLGSLWRTSSLRVMDCHENGLCYCT